MLKKIAKIVTLLGVAATPLVVIPYVSYPFIFGKTLFLMTIAILLLSSIVVLACNNENRRELKKIFKNPMVYMPIMLLLVDSIISLFGIDIIRSFVGNEERGMGLLQLWSVMVVYISAWIFLPTLKEKKLMIYTVVVGSIAVVLAAFSRYAGVTLFGIDTGFRISGTIANAIFFAQIELLYIAIALFIVIDDAEKKWVRYGAAAIALLHVAGIILSKTRGTFIALLVFAIVCGLYVVWNHKEWRGRVRKGFGGLVILLVILLGSSVTLLKDNSDLARLTKFSLSEITLTTRVLAWKAGLNAFLERPILGWGNENFKYAFDKYYEPALLQFGYSETHFDRAHNIVIERLVNFGATGLLLYGIYFFGVLVVVLQDKKIHTTKKMLFTGIWCANHVHLLLAFDTALSVLLQLSLFYFVAQEMDVEIKEPDNVYVAIGSVVILSVGPLMYGVVYPYMSSNYIVKGFTLADSGLYTRALPYYELALRTPSMYFSSPREEFLSTAGSILQSPTVTDGAAREWLYQRAHQLVDELIEKNPYYSHYYELKGNLYITRIYEGGDYSDQALVQYNKAQKLSPKRQSYYLAIAQICNLQRKFELADKEYTEALALAPNVLIMKLYKGVSLLVLHKDEEAKKLILPLLKSEAYVNSFQDWQILANSLAGWGEYRASAFYYLVGVRDNQKNEDIILLFAASAYRAQLYREAYEALKYLAKLNGVKKDEAIKLITLLPEGSSTKPFTFDEANDFFQKN